MTNPIDPDREGGIAVIGMAGRFPGAKGIGEFWANLRKGRDLVSRFSDEELAQAGRDVPKVRSDARFVAAGAVLDEAEWFDARFFGMSPKEAEITDPQQRVFLEVTWEAMEHAGYDPTRIAAVTGVFAGMSPNTYWHHNLKSRPDVLRSVAPMAVLMGNERDYLATRVAYKLDLKGPAVNLSTACSTSLTAVVSAIQSLQDFQCDVALAGGVSIVFPQRPGYFYEEGAIASPDGHCRPFDANAAGTVSGQGAGVVVLKRLPEALADGDTVYAVIRGGAMNNDGANKVSFTAPSVDGQAEVIAGALAFADVDPSTVSYIEAHGTATPLGDPIEIAALHQVFGSSGLPPRSCAIGSVKSNMGHLDAAAGIAGLIKTVLALHYREIPPSLHFERPNPRIDFDRGPFFVNTDLSDWDYGPAPRRAGVSSFGIGGTNVHVVLEEAPPAGALEEEDGLELLVLSARSPEALDRTSVNLANHLKEHPSANLADVAFTLKTGRAEFPHRRIVTAREPVEVAEALERPGDRRVASGEARTTPPSVVFMFPGQGAQRVGMGRELYDREPVFRDVVDSLSQAIERDLGVDLVQLMYPPDDKADWARETLGQTQFTQPALFAVEAALASLWVERGVRPEALIGHSIGEYVAASIAGVMEPTDAMRLVAARGRLIQAQPTGAMLAIRAAADSLDPYLREGVSLAAANAPNLCVVSGPLKAVEEVEARLGANGVWSRRLQTSHAFHSAMMDPVLDPFADLVAEVRLRPPSIPFISNVTGTWITDEEATDPSYWASHIRRPVRFADGIAELQKGADRLFLEVGPGQSLSQIARQGLRDVRSTPVVASLPAAGQEDASDEILGAFGRLWIAGASLDWASIQGPGSRRRVPLPTYPFDRKRYWVEPASSPSTEPEAPTIDAGWGTDDTAHAQAGVPDPAPDKASAEHALDPLDARVTRLLADAIGSEPADISPDAGFLDLGFESITLTQVSQELRREFGVEVTFRQLMEDLSTRRAVSRYLADQLSTVAPPPSLVSPRDGTAPEAPRAVPVKETEAGLVPEEPAAHGPFRPLKRTPDSALSPRQAEHLNRLVRRYLRRTGSSRAFAEEHRTTLADPRAAGGFNRLWKDLVYPIVAGRSSGSRIWDLDGNEYIDFTMGFGTNLLGHSPDLVLRALAAQMEKGFEIGPQTPLAGRVATLISELTGNERTAFCNTGSEAVLAALRLARTVTGRDKIVAFLGSYHGIFDEVVARPSLRTGTSLPAAPGIPASAVENLVILDYGTPESLRTIETMGHELAGVLVEPVQSRNLELQPWSFLRRLRDSTARTNTALIFDEVITGFRVHPGGIQALLDIRADIVTYGKIAGGGMPIGVVSGKRRFLDALDGGMWHYGDDSFPEVGVTMFAGTFVRHPLALAAGEAVLAYLKQQGPSLQLQLSERVTDVVRRLRGLLAEFEAPFDISHFASLFYVVPRPGFDPRSLFFYYLREKGIHAWENRAFVFTTAHSDEDVERLLQAFRESLEEMRTAGFFGEAEVSRRTTADDGGVIRRLPDGTLVAPLTEMQTEVWLAAQLDEKASVAYNDSMSIRLRGELDVDLLRASLQEVVDRHDALRTTFSPDGESQRICPFREQELDFMDLGELPGPERDAGLQQAMAEQDQEPFDLEEGPLVRARLIRVDPEEHLLHLTAHHLAVDGWSWRVLLEGLHTAYGARREGVDGPTLEPAFQYHEYVRWLNRPEEVERDQASERFWMDRFGDQPTPVELPSDRPRTGRRTFQAGTCEVGIEPELMARVREGSRACGVTLSTFLLGTFSAWLHRMTGHRDLVVGLPVSGQHNPGLHGIPGTQQLVGHCVNMLPIRVACDPDDSFREFVTAVRTETLDCLEHQNFTFGRLLRTREFSRGGDRSPLVSVTFNVDVAPEGQVQFIPGLEAEIATPLKPAVFFDLVVNIADQGERARASFTYAADRFSPDTVERWTRGWLQLVEAFLDSPDDRLGSSEILTSEDRRLLESWNETDRDFPSDSCLHDLISSVAARNPDQVAVTDEHGHLTCKELDARANQLAQALVSRGVGPGVLVGLCMQRSADMVMALLGVLKAGGAYVPLDPDYPPERLQFIVADAKVHLLVTEEHLTDALAATGSELLLIDSEWSEMGQKSTDDPSVDVGPEDLAYVIYTSGSTGQPKGVRVHHRALVNFLASMAERPGLAPSDVMLAVTTISFDIAALELYLPLLVGARVVVASRSAASRGDALARLIKDHAVSVMQATPATWRLLLAEEWPGDPGLKILCGGEPLRPELARDLLPRCAELWNMYGPTETTVWSTCCRVTDPNDIDIGRPIHNTTLHILDDHLRPVPIGAVGELVIGGEGVAKGYLDRPDLTETRFVPDPDDPDRPAYRTGDLARYRATGAVECLGRNDDQVKIRGFRIELGEVESALADHPDVELVAVTVADHGTDDPRLLAFLVPRAGAELDESELRSRLRRRLPDYMVPSAFMTLDELPLTPNGKIDRGALPTAADSRITSPARGELPRTEMERTIAELWHEVLQVDQVRVTDNFFDLGGHSLLAVRFARALQNARGLRVDPGDLAFQTLEQLASQAGDNDRPAVRVAALDRVHPEKESFYFGPSHSPLFGSFHPSVGKSVRRTGVVLSYPMGQEYIRTHRAYLQLGIRLATKGFPCLRFDYFGSGDSAGEGVEARLDRWTVDLDTAIAKLKEKGDLTNVAMVGLRLGATLAAQVAAQRDDVRLLVLWNPVVDGAVHRSELRSLHRSLVRTSYVDASLDTSRAPAGAELEIMGFRWAGALLDDIEKLNLLQLTEAPAADILLVDSAGDPSLEELARHFRHLGSTVTLERIPGPSLWLEEPFRELIPVEIWQRVTAWVSERA